MRLPDAIALMARQQERSNGNDRKNAAQRIARHRQPTPRGRRERQEPANRTQGKASQAGAEQDELAEHGLPPLQVVSLLPRGHTLTANCGPARDRRLVDMNLSMPAAAARKRHGGVQAVLFGSQGGAARGAFANVGSRHGDPDIRGRAVPAGDGTGAGCGYGAGFEADCGHAELEKATTELLQLRMTDAR
jgi:hypothetical protein